MNREVKKNDKRERKESGKWERKESGEGERERREWQAKKVRTRKKTLKENLRDFVHMKMDGDTGLRSNFQYTYLSMWISSSFDLSI